MPKRSLLLVGLFFLALPSLMAGCGQTTSDAVVPPPDHADRIKKMLSGLSEDGNRANLVYVRQELKVLKDAGDARAATISADVDKLEKTTNPAEFKALAGKAADKIVIVTKPPDSP